MDTKNHQCTQKYSNFDAFHDTTATPVSSVKDIQSSIFKRNHRCPNLNKTSWFKLFDALKYLWGTYLYVIFIRWFYLWKSVKKDSSRSSVRKGHFFSKFRKFGFVFEFPRVLSRKHQNIRFRFPRKRHIVFFFSEFSEIGVFAPTKLKISGPALRENPAFPLFISWVFPRFGVFEKTQNIGFRFPKNPVFRFFDFRVSQNVCSHAQNLKIR